MNKHNPAQRTLFGTTVLEFASIFAIPSCGLHHADMGADVIKIEPLTRDLYRKKYYPTV